MSPEIADFRAGPKSGDLRAGRLSNADPRRSAQSVDFRTPFPPETRPKTRDRHAKKRARPSATPCQLPPAVISFRSGSSATVAALHPVAGGRQGVAALPPVARSWRARRGSRQGAARGAPRRQGVDVKKRARPFATPCRLPPSGGAAGKAAGLLPAACRRAVRARSGRQGVAPLPPFAPPRQGVALLP